MHKIKTKNFFRRPNRISLDFQKNKMLNNNIYKHKKNKYINTKLIR
jgi:hypothetical protein